MEVQIFIEGGGNNVSQQKILRIAFEEFFKELRDLARSKRTACRIIMGGSRDTTLSDFKRALRSHSHAFNILLIDAEDNVEHPPLEHLVKRDSWDVKGIAEDQCHLMVTMMEAWFLADREVLVQFYGQGFNSKALPGNPKKVEEILKLDVENGLRNATRQTQKADYHKMNHGPKLLQLIDPQKVRAAAPHCDRLFRTVEAKLGE